MWITFTSCFMECLYNVLGLLIEFGLGNRNIIAFVYVAIRCVLLPLPYAISEEHKD